MASCLIKQNLIKALKGPEGPYHALQERGHVGYHFETLALQNAKEWPDAWSSRTLSRPKRSWRTYWQEWGHVRYHFEAKVMQNAMECPGSWSGRTLSRPLRVLKDLITHWGIGVMWGIILKLRSCRMQWNGQMLDLIGPYEGLQGIYHFSIPSIPNWCQSATFIYPPYGAVD